MIKKVEEGEINNSELSYDTKTLITVITLVTVYPVGLILMFAWMKWRSMIKFLILLPFIIGMMVPILLVVMAGAIFLKMGENLTKPETIREFRQMIEVTPTEMMRGSAVDIIKK